MQRCKEILCEVEESDNSWITSVTAGAAHVRAAIFSPLTTTPPSLHKHFRHCLQRLINKGNNQMWENSTSSQCFLTSSSALRFKSTFKHQSISKPRVISQKLFAEALQQLDGKINRDGYKSSGISQPPKIVKIHPVLLPQKRFNHAKSRYCS